MKCGHELWINGRLRSQWRMCTILRRNLGIRSGVSKKQKHPGFLFSFLWFFLKVDFNLRPRHKHGPNSECQRFELCILRQLSRPPTRNWSETKPKKRRANRTCLLPYVTRFVIEGDMRVLGWSHFRRVIFSRLAFRAERDPARKELLKAKELWTYITAKERRYGVNLNSIYLSHLLLCDWVWIWEGWRNPKTHTRRLFLNTSHADRHSERFE